MHQAGCRTASMSLLDLFLALLAVAFLYVLVRAPESG